MGRLSIRSKYYFSIYEYGGEQKLAAPKEIIELVERFKHNISEYRAGHYNETELRRDFVDPFFKALGWDVDNKKGNPEMYREVVHEDAVKVRGSTKAPDYGFYLGGIRKFFVEAKKPSVNLENNVKAAFQLRSYAWSANLPISILTDFEEFALYDCRVEPSNSDSPKIARLRHFTYDKYVDNWDRIAALFSREAVLNGSLDKYIESTKRRKNTLTVDEAFLREIDHWREIIAKNIHLNNSELTIRQLNSAVQNTIDRIVFLRICEDRGIEMDGRLKALLDGEKAIYTMLCEQFQQADEKYNSGIFYFKKESFRHGEPDELTLNLNIDDDVLREIIENLYPPKSPYRFSVIPAEILGHVYEQFLGKVISLTEDHQIEVEFKPEVRKAGGVYYTPTYIVDYIVENTVGKLLEGNTPKGASELRILDPACGSGSFLIGAYQYLLDWHLKWYIDHLSPYIKAGKTPTSREVKNLLPEGYNETTKKRGRGRPKKRESNPVSQLPIREVKLDEWRLTTTERKRILLNNVYGVDIDHQATEVTKLSLQLKVLEGESQETIIKQLKISQERALPDLGDNIKCGNSLIGPDFYDSQMTLFDEEEMYRVNAFDWDGEFSEVMGRGGFDAVIGNPPYIDSEWMTQYLPFCRQYCNSRYEAASGNWDIFCVFIEKAISLCKNGGLSGFIVPNKLGSAEYASGARKVLSTNNGLQLIRDYSSVPVFPVAVYPIIYITKRETPNSKSVVLYERMNSDVDIAISQKLPYSTFFFSPNIPWEIFSDTKASYLNSRLRDTYPPLGDVAEVLGAATVNEAYMIKPLISEELNPASKELKMINSGTIDRYNMLWGYKKMNYIKDSYQYPTIKAADIHNLPIKRKKQSWTPKIIVASMTKLLECALDLEGGILAGKSTTVIFPSDNDLKYFAAILNSKLINYFFINVFAGNRLSGGYLRVGPPQLKTIPIRTIDFSDPQDVARHDKMIQLVDGMLELNNRLSESKTEQEKTTLQRLIDATDRQIDRLVYDLYNLTEDEIKIVEDSKH